MKNFFWKNLQIFVFPSSFLSSPERQNSLRRLPARFEGKQSLRTTSYNRYVLHGVRSQSLSWDDQRREMLNVNPAELMRN